MTGHENDHLQLCLQMVIELAEHKILCHKHRGISFRTMCYGSWCLVVVCVVFLSSTLNSRYELKMFKACTIDGTLEDANETALQELLISSVEPGTYTSL